MALTELDPAAALIVVDLQKGVVGMPTVHPIAEVVRNAAALAEAFRARGLPVVLVTATGVAPGRNEQPLRTTAFPEGFADLVPELNARPGDHLVAKRTWGAFTNTDLADFLKGRGITQVVVCGVATSIGAESTARQAHELGFNVALAIDAMTDLNLEAHTNSVQRIFPRLGQTASTRDILAHLPSA